MAHKMASYKKGKAGAAQAGPTAKTHRIGGIPSGDFPDSVQTSRLNEGKDEYFRTNGMRKAGGRRGMKY